ncbi:PREDICTED: uncharacterized protein LOC105448229 [Wasmannia auropunctata]|uniref:uncharacterized protein LOC105448229 n=1 Tax=Wasmannia auropunctata TaxID=64793 RepID=UPI0005ED6CD0|nr:PREDICTED: uncharacterized protein LOC105448229 [Wasmannia auropunctata]
MSCKTNRNKLRQFFCQTGSSDVDRFYNIKGFLCENNRVINTWDDSRLPSEWTDFEEGRAFLFFLPYLCSAHERWSICNMVRSSKSLKRTGVMSAHGNDATIDSSPYYFRRTTRESVKPQDDRATPSQNADDKPSIILTIGSSKGRYKYCACCLAGMLTILLCVVIGGMLFPYPLHASCIVKWKFDEPCASVMQKFRRQISNWSSWNTCRQRDGTCLYTLKLPVENNVIRATHRTSNLKSLERLEIVFEKINNTCLAKANSVSSEWFMIFDHGTNYCNLHNLVVGAGLDRNAKFLELTSDAVCTQFNMAVCL